MVIGRVDWCEDYPCEEVVCVVCKGAFQQEEGEPDQYGHPVLYCHADDSVGSAAHWRCFEETYTTEILSGDLKEGQTIVSDEEDLGIFLWKVKDVSKGNGVVHWVADKTTRGSYYQYDSKVRILKG